MRIRILLAIHPRMMREVAKQMIQRSEDMEVVGEFLAPSDFLAAVRETGANAVILTLSGSEKPGRYSHLLAEYPNLTILGLDSEGKATFVGRRSLGWREIVNPSEAEILRALRGGV